MKKFFLILAFCTVTLGVFAQNSAQKTPFEITPENMQSVLDDLFSSQNSLATTAKGSAQKKWQAAFFLTSNNVTWDYINDLTKKLQREHKKGTLQYAVVLYDRKAKDEPKYRKQEDGVYLYTIGDFYPQKHVLSKEWTEEAPMYDYFFRPNLSQHEGSISDLLDAVLSRMNRHAHTYNYFKIHAHGSGTNMSHYAQDKYNFTFKTVHDAIKKQGIHIDVLDVHSCMMGTAVNAYNVLAGGHVDYLLFASNIGMTWYKHSNTPILNHLDKKPAEAAQAAVNDKFSKEFISKNKTNNLMLISNDSIPTLKDFVRWLTKIYPEHPLPAARLPIPVDSPNTDFHNLSLNKVLAAWKTTIPCDFANLTQNGNCKLQIQGNTLRKKMQDVILTYRCWDASRQVLYTDVKRVPADSECMDGMSINKKYLRKK